MTMLAAPTSNLAPQAATQSTPRPYAGRPARRTTAVATAARRADSLPAYPPDTTEHLLRVRVRLPAAHPDRDVLRTRAIEDNLPLANRLAWRYAGRGERYDNLVQVAALALVKAVDGYNPDRTTPVVGYAVPTSPAPDTAGPAWSPTPGWRALFSSYGTFVHIVDSAMRVMLASTGHPHLILRLGTIDPADSGRPHAPRLPADQIIERA
ncbi:sigma factor [Dactylosporangium darangshiense]|uniref:RNA polymerase sigma-70 region 2 domain-containing protein n=1 Tax=Dactylosporangium darangshiense TaxID=579108 RepID=A0ABP8DWD1_9ACTN